jgi:SAM-dependent methyltransferase
MPGVAAIWPGAITQQWQFYRLGRKIKQHGSRRLADLPAAIEESMDSAKMERLWRDVREEYRRNPASAAKYAMPRQWLLLNTMRAGDLGLHTGPRLQILDIGCGPAFFLAVSRALGHEAVGVDVPESLQTLVERRVYRGFIDILRCGPSVSPLPIERFVPLPFPEERFDLITAFWICFNLHRQPGEWGVEEWRYFVEDAIGRLRPGGRLFLDLNENPERYAELRFYDKPTLEYFRSVGSVEGGRVLVSRRQQP